MPLLVVAEDKPFSLLARHDNKDSSLFTIVVVVVVKELEGL
jgi:hypothetical protein